MPVTMPVDDTVAMDGLLLLQPPPVVAIASGVVSPAQVAEVPVMAGMPPATVTFIVLAQPLGPV